MKYIGIVLSVVAVLSTTRATRTFEQSVELFDWDLFKECLPTDTSTNYVIAPLSVQLALSLTLMGANDQTYCELLNTLRLTGTKDHVASLVRQFLAPIAQASSAVDSSDNDTAVFVIADRAFVNERFSILPGYAAVLKNSFFTDAQSLSFADTTAAAAIINDWVAAQTHRLILQIVSPPALSATTGLVLVNSIYFNSKWQHAFEARSTTDQPFYLADGTSTQVATMSQANNFRYAQLVALDSVLVQLPYTLPNFTFSVLLPNKPDGLPALLKKLDTYTIGKALRSELLTSTYLQLELPKFDISFEVTLNGPLQKLGIKQAFTNKANFSGISKDIGLFISSVLHKVHIIVDELGTKAAAVTGIVIGTTAVRQPPDTVVKCNNPFMFVLSKNNVPVFIGTYNGPGQIAAGQ